MRDFIYKHYERFFSGMKAFYWLLGSLALMYVLFEYVVPLGYGDTFRHVLAFICLTLYSLLATAIILNIARRLFAAIFRPVDYSQISHPTGIDISAPGYRDPGELNPLLKEEGMYHGDFLIVNGTYYDTSLERRNDD